MERYWEQLQYYVQLAVGVDWKMRFEGLLTRGKQTVMTAC